LQGQALCLPFFGEPHEKDFIDFEIILVEN